MDVEELYGLPLERFVPERNALTRELRAAGKRDEAAEVASLRKPSVAARAVNQLARTHRRELDRLFTAGDALSEVQSSVLAGQAGGRDLSEAHARERDAVSALVEAASPLLTAEGLTPSASVLERIGETLHAAALDDDARKTVDEGRLERELRHVGLGMGAGTDVAAPAKRAPTKRRAARGTPMQEKAREQAEAQQQAEAQERAEAAKRARALQQAQTTEKGAGRQAERAAKALDDAERAHAHAVEALEQAKETLTTARRDAKATETAHRKAERELRRLES
jgi:hypothetical protein